MSHQIARQTTHKTLIYIHKQTPYLGGNALPGLLEAGPRPLGDGARALRAACKAAFLNLRNPDLLCLAIRLESCLLSDIGGFMRGLASDVALLRAVLFPFPPGAAPPKT